MELIVLAIVMFVLAVLIFGRKNEKAKNDSAEAFENTGEDELDRRIGEWTKDFTAEQVMTMLQGAGVPAGVVETAEDLFKDPQLKYRHQPKVCRSPGDRALFLPGTGIHTLGDPL